MKIKICGLRSLAMAQAAENAGADFIGFVFAPSHRYITPEAAAMISQRIHGCQKVGVFVDEDVREVNRIALQCKLDFVQLHGHEDAVYARKVCIPVIKAFRWGDDFSVDAANANPARYILLDSFTKGMAGGTGQSFSWLEAAAQVSALTKPFLVAGGINASNVRTVKIQLHPFGVDASGSLEVNGEKDQEKIREFIAAVKAGETA